MSEGVHVRQSSTVLYADVVRRRQFVAVVFVVVCDIATDVLRAPSRHLRHRSTGLLSDSL